MTAHDFALLAIGFLVGYNVAGWLWIWIWDRRRA